MVFWSSAARVRHSFAACALVLCAALALRVPAAAADITPEARKVVEHYLEAIGGRAAFEAVHSVHGTGKVSAFGFTGSIDTWTARPDKRASRMDIGPLKIQEGYDGSTAWRTDPGGKVIVLDGIDRDRSIASAWFDADRWLEPDQGGGKVSLAKQEEPQGPYDVLLIEAPGGETRRIWVNRDTGLIDKVVAKSDQNTVISTLSRYRAFAGLRLATMTKTSIEGMPANDVTVAFDTLEVNTDMSAAPFGLPGEGDHGVRYLKQDGTARLAFDYAAKHLWVRASVNGNPPADFIYDTGASITVIDSTYAAQIGLEAQGHMQGQGAGATGSVSLATLDDLKVAGDDGDGIEMKNVPVAVLSVNPMLEPFFWKPAAGIVGFNFISQFVNEIDYDTGTIVLRDPKAFEYQGQGEAIPMELAGTVPAIEMTLDGRYKGKFRIDVGSSATVDLHRPFVEANGIDKKVKDGVEVLSGGFGGMFTSRMTRMKSIAIGPYSWKNPMVSLSGATTGALASSDYAGNIGNRILDRFKCTFDYEHRVLYLEPGARYARPDHFTRSGLQLVKKDGVISIAQVIDGSPAQKAGLEVGDVIRAIDGRAAADWKHADVETLFEEGKPGTEVVFKVERDGRAMNVKFKLRDFV